jgi:hypothetical protein
MDPADRQVRRLEPLLARGNTRVFDRGSDAQVVKHAECGRRQHALRIDVDQQLPFPSGKPPGLVVVWRWSEHRGPHKVRMAQLLRVTALRRRLIIPRNTLRASAADQCLNAARELTLGIFRSLAPSPPRPLTRDAGIRRKHSMRQWPRQQLRMGDRRWRHS